MSCEHFYAILTLGIQFHFWGAWGAHRVGSTPGTAHVILSSGCELSCSLGSRLSATLRVGGCTEHTSVGCVGEQMSVGALGRRHSHRLLVNDHSIRCLSLLVPTAS